MPEARSDPAVKPANTSSEYVRVTLAWLPLLRAAMDQPNATPILAREIQRILEQLPEDLQP